MRWLSREAGRASVSVNEIFTAFRTVEAQVPGKISSVVGNLTTNGWVRNAGRGAFSLTHVGEDNVDLKLPKAKTEGKKK
jgi:hypothetical protein